MRMFVGTKKATTQGSTGVATVGSGAELRIQPSTTSSLSSSCVGEPDSHDGDRDVSNGVTSDGTRMAYMMYIRCTC